MASLGLVLLVSASCTRGEAGVRAAESLAATSIVPEGWRLVWRDEFSGSGLDPTKWQHEVDAWGGGNEELQFYTDRERNSRVEGGVLVIEAHAEDYGGVDPTDGEHKERSYTSGRLHTKGLGDWRYGRFEVRAKLPAGQGFWPAIWMMPSDDAYGGWAASGEIDIVEAVGHELDQVHGTLHYGGAWPHNQHTGAAFDVPGGDYSSDFHVFCLEWEEEEIRWYVDGVHYQTQQRWHTSGARYPAPFDQPFHLIVNLAVGGTWPGPPTESTPFPSRLEIDYVRVFERVPEAGSSEAYSRSASGT